MNKQEYLFSVLAEECAELAQECSKVNRFGLYSVNSLDSESVQKRVLGEFADIVTAMQMIFDENYISKDNEYIKSKMQKRETKSTSTWLYI